VLSMGDGILTNLSFRSPDPTSPRSETSTQLGEGGDDLSSYFLLAMGQWGVSVVVLVSGVDLCTLQRPPIQLDGGLMCRQR
jgi:hypothetical protein